MRLWRAFLIAPLLPTLIFAATLSARRVLDDPGQMADALMLFVNLCLFITYPITLFLGLPLLSLLRDRIRPNAVITGLVGAFIAGLMPLLATLLMDHPDERAQAVRELLLPGMALGFLGGFIYFRVATAGQRE